MSARTCACQNPSMVLLHLMPRSAAACFKALPNIPGRCSSTQHSTMCCPLPLSGRTYHPSRRRTLHTAAGPNTALGELQNAVSPASQSGEMIANFAACFHSARAVPWQSYTQPWQTKHVAMCTEQAKEETPAASPAPAAAELDMSALDIRVGRILQVEDHPEADKYAHKMLSQQLCAAACPGSTSRVCSGLKWWLISSQLCGSCSSVVHAVGQGLHDVKQPVLPLHVQTAPGAVQALCGNHRCWRGRAENHRKWLAGLCGQGRPEGKFGRHGLLVC